MGVYICTGYINITITNSSITDNVFYGIYTAAYGIIIKECTIARNTHGVSAEAGYNLTIMKCKIIDNAVGIDFRINQTYIIDSNITGNFLGLGQTWYSPSGPFFSDVYIQGCNVHNNDFGILLATILNVTISHCNVYNNFVGTELCYVNSSNIFYSNIYSNTMLGISMFHSYSIILRNDTFLNNSVFIEYSYGNTVENCTVNGKPLIYLENQQNVVISQEAGQIILVNCENITIVNQNIIDTPNWHRTMANEPHNNNKFIYI